MKTATVKVLPQEGVVGSKWPASMKEDIAEVLNLLCLATYQVNAVERDRTCRECSMKAAPIVRAIGDQEMFRLATRLQRRKERGGVR